MTSKRDDKPADPRVSITLSPRQVEQIVRAVEPDRAPGFTTLIMDLLNRVENTPAYADRRLSRALMRGLAVLACFGPEHETLGLMEIAEHLGLNGSTIHRYVMTLVAVGLLEQSPETRKYSLPSV